jgi:hypothetical protein
MDINYRVFNDGQVFVNIKDLKILLYKDLNITESKEQRDYIKRLISGFEQAETDLKRKRR